MANHTGSTGRLEEGLDAGAGIGAGIGAGAGALAPAQFAVLDFSVLSMMRRTVFEIPTGSALLSPGNCGATLP